MKKYTVVLASQGDKVVVKAHSLSLNFQHAMMGGDSLSDGNISISGKQDVKLANGQTLELDLKPVNVRLAELETQLDAMPAGEEKATTQCKFNIWSLCLADIQKTIATALKAQYNLDNPATV